MSADDGHCPAAPSDMEDKDIDALLRTHLFERH
jgi:hypothetical protein